MIDNMHLNTNVISHIYVCVCVLCRVVYVCVNRVCYKCGRRGARSAAANEGAASECAPLRPHVRYIMRYASHHGYKFICLKCQQPIKSS